MIDDHLHAGSLRELFIEHLGWDHARGTETIEIDGNTIELERVAQKRGFLVLLHLTDRARAQTKRYIRQIQARVSRLAHEHLLVVMDHRSGVHVWAWAYHDGESGRLKHRFHPFFTDRIPSALVARIERLSVAIEEEETVTLVEITRRAEEALDADADQNVFFRRPGYALQSQQLASRMREGGLREFHEFVVFHLKLAPWFAQRYKKLANDLEDMAQEATVGLVRAAKRFDPDYGTAFSTYAYAAMRNECHRCLPSLLPLGRVPDYVYWPYRRVLREWECAERSGGHDAGLDARDNAIEEEGLSDSVALDTHRAFHAVSLERRLGSHWTECLGVVEFTHEVIGVGSARHPISELVLAELCEIVCRCIDSLDPMDQRIVRGRYGIACARSTLQELGEQLAVTRERVRQREEKALESLRSVLTREYGEDVLPWRTHAASDEPSPEEEDEGE